MRHLISTLCVLNVRSGHFDLNWAVASEFVLCIVHTRNDNCLKRKQAALSFSTTLCLIQELSVSYSNRLAIFLMCSSISVFMTYEVKTPDFFQLNYCEVIKVIACFVFL